MMVGLQSDIAVQVAGIGCKLGRVQQIVKKYDKRRVSYIFPVPLGHKDKDIVVYLNWYQRAKGGEGTYSYTLSDINPVNFSNVIRKVTMVQQGRSKSWRLSVGDREALNGGTRAAGGKCKGKGSSGQGSSMTKTTFLAVTKNLTRS